MSAGDGLDGLDEQLAADKEIADRLCDVEAGLSPRELDFVEDMAKQTTAGRTMTEKQRDWALDILARVGR